MTDVVIVGAGMVGASCAYYASLAGLSVTIVDRGSVAAGTTSRGEGNILVSDKQPGPELELALWSRQLWLRIAADLGAGSLELEEKGGLVVARDSLVSLNEFGAEQAAAGVVVQPVDGDSLDRHEPHISPNLAGGLLYPQDLQVQPVLAASRLLEVARGMGARVLENCTVTGIERCTSGQLRAVLVDGTAIATSAVVNAAGPWGGEVARLLQTPVPVLPRRGFVLVTEPLPKVVFHKVYSADYVDSVSSDQAGLETSAVIEGTQGGTVLIGASRERIGFDNTFSVDIVRRLVRQAVEIFPMLAKAHVIRAYQGFRPYCPDHLPVIGEDARVPGVLHACGHEGAGIGLGPATGRLVTQLLTGEAPGVDPVPYSPLRFDQVAS